MHKIEFKEEFKGVMHIVCKAFFYKNDIIVCKVLANKPAFTMLKSNVKKVSPFMGLPLLPKPTVQNEIIRPNPSTTQRPRANRNH